MDAQATFRMVIPGQVTAPDVLGVWQTVPAQTSLAPGLEEDQVTVWQVDLPADPPLAAAALAQRTGRLLSAQHAMPLAAKRLEAFVQRAPPAGMIRAESYASPPAGIPQPERELAAWLLAEQGVENYAGLKDLRAGLQQATQQVSEFADQLCRTLTQFAWVQTTSGGRTLGRTSVAWLGDVNTLWGRDLSLEQAVLHRRTLALALASRQAWIRLALLVAASAVRLSTLLASPLAIPAAFKFITQVMAEFGQLGQTIHPSTE